MKAVIAYRNKVLLVREPLAHDTNTQAQYYGFPGDRIEPGEKWQDGLRREVREETGMEVEIGQPLYVGEWRPTIKGVPHQIIALLIVCQSADAAVHLSEEHDQYRWVDGESWRTLDVMNPDDEVLEAYFCRGPNIDTKASNPAVPLRLGSIIGK